MPILAAQLLQNLEGATMPGEPLRENYHPLTGEVHNAAHFSWTATPLVDRNGLREKSEVAITWS